MQSSRKSSPPSKAASFRNFAAAAAEDPAASGARAAARAASVDQEDPMALEEGRAVAREVKVPVGPAARVALRSNHRMRRGKASQCFPPGVDHQVGSFFCGNAASVVPRDFEKRLSPDDPFSSF
jgi:hypothetical protein